MASIVTGPAGDDRGATTMAAMTVAPYRNLRRSIPLFLLSGWLVVAAALTAADGAPTGVGDLRHDRVPPDRADVLVGDATGAVDEETLRQAPDPVVDRDLPARIPAIRVGNREFLEEVARRLFLILSVDAQ